MPDPSLLGLPIELQISILQQIADFTSLGALVLASRKYCRAYYSTRCEILTDLLHRQYGGDVDIVESLTAVRSQGLWAKDKRNSEKIIALLDFRRRAGIESEIARYQNKLLTAAELVKLLALHEVARFFINDYSKSLKQPSWWQADVQGDWERVVLPIRFSSNERVRFFRAFYRFQTWCHIFGQEECHPSCPSNIRANSTNQWCDTTFSREDAWYLLWGTMPQWEVEEVGCIWRYFFSKYGRFFEEITNVLEAKLNLDPEYPPFINPEWLPSSHLLCEVYDLIVDTSGFTDPAMFSAERRAAFVDFGPCYLFRLLRMPYEQRQDSIVSNVRILWDEGLWEVESAKDLTDEWGDQTPRLLFPADRYERNDLADVISSFPILDQPNLGWIKKWCDSSPLHPDIWRSRYYYVESATDVSDEGHVWDWGYVLWDSDRVVQWKAPSLGKG